MSEPPTAHRRLTDAIRVLVERATMTDAADDTLERAKRLVEEASALLERSTPYERLSLLAGTPQWDPSIEMPTHPIIGDGNALAPGRVALRGAGSAIHGSVRYGTPYQGPDGLVHGGVIAGLFDALQATTASAEMGAALTHTLTVRYRRPTPLWRDLEVASHVERVDGRKVFTAATITADGEVTAESTGFFVCSDRSTIGD